MSAATIELAAATDAYCAAEDDLFDLRAVILASRTSVFVGPRSTEDELRCAMRRCLGVFAQSADRLAAALDSAAAVDSTCADPTAGVSATPQEGA